MEPLHFEQKEVVEVAAAFLTKAGFAAMLAINRKETRRVTERQRENYIFVEDINRRSGQRANGKLQKKSESGAKPRIQL